MTYLVVRHGRLLAGHHVPLRLVLELLHALPRQAGRLPQVRPLARRATALQMREPEGRQESVGVQHDLVGAPKRMKQARSRANLDSLAGSSCRDRSTACHQAVMWMQLLLHPCVRCIQAVKSGRVGARGALAAEVVDGGGVHEVGAPAHAVAQVVRQHLRVVLQDLPVDQVPHLWLQTMRVSVGLCIRSSTELRRSSVTEHCMVSHDNVYPATS